MATCTFVSASGSKLVVSSNPTLTGSQCNAASGWYVLSNNEAQLYDVQQSPFDLTTALSATTFFFSMTLFFWAVGRGAGAVLEKIRRPTGY